MGLGRRFMRQSRGQTDLASGRGGGCACGAFERDNTASFNDTFEDGFGEVGVVRDAPSEPESLGGGDHRAIVAVALVDEIE